MKNAIALQTKNTTIKKIKTGICFLVIARAKYTLAQDGM